MSKTAAISRAEQGYQDRLKKEDVSLREVRCEVAFGGFVWVNITDDAPPLREYVGGALDILEPFMEQPMEVFHFHKAQVRTNFKLWHDTNMTWGPFGRNLHEDLLGVTGQGRAMRKGTDSRYVLQGREEASTIHDEVGMRHFYAEWSKRMGRPAYDPYRAAA